MKRYDLGWDHGDAFMEQDPTSDYIKHADHLAFVAQVREVAEGMEHDEKCAARVCVAVVNGVQCLCLLHWHDAFASTNHEFSSFADPMEALMRDHAMDPGKCTCPRGRLLAMCER